MKIGLVKTGDFLPKHKPENSTDRLQISHMMC